MKNLRLACSALALSAIITFSACQKEDAVSPDEVELSFSAPEYQLEDIKALENTDITGATESSDYRMSDNDRQRSDRHHLGFILKKLNLKEDQRNAVKGFVHAHSVCVAEHCRKVHEIHRELLRKANAVREEYVQAYRAGRITKAELESKLQQLRQRVKEEIQKHEQKQIHLRIIRKCRAELFHNIESVLNHEQLQLWNRWKQSL